VHIEPRTSSYSVTEVCVTEVCFTLSARRAGLCCGNRARDRRDCPSRICALTTQAVYYRDASGREPVDAWIDTLPAKVALKVDDSIDLLNGLPDNAPPLAFPFSSQIDGSLRELRCHYGKRLIRILYQRSDNLVVLLHTIEKAGRTIPERDIELAKQRMADFRARMDARPRVPPRAAGPDAPSAARSHRQAERSLD